MKHVYWCPSCGIVWADPKGAPLCRHNVPDPDLPPRRMEPLPDWHPFATDEVAA